MPELPPPPVSGLLYQVFPGPDGTVRLEFLSDGAEAVLEASADELAGMLVSKTLPIVGPDLGSFYTSFSTALATVSPWSREFGYRGPATGSVRWYRAQNFPQTAADGTRYYSGVLIDVTVLKDTEEKSRGLYRELLSHIDNTPLAVIEWDGNFRVRRWTGQAEAIFGWAADEVLGKRPDEWRFVHEDDAGSVREVMANLTVTAQPRNVLQNRNYTKEGRVLHCEWHNSVLHADVGWMKSCLSLVLDVTERVTAAEKLRRGEERLRTALACAEMLGWESDVRTGRLSFSGNYEEFFGVVGLEAGPDTAKLVVHPDDRPRATDAVRESLQREGPWALEFRGAADDAEGRPRYFLARGRTNLGADGKPEGQIGVIADISPRKREEAERAALDRTLLESRRTQSLGVLAGGVAHDFNNLLTVIIGNASLAALQADDPQAVRDAAGEIETAGRRAADLCRSMLAYAGQTPQTPRRVNLSEFVADAGDLLDPALAHRVGIRINRPQPTPDVIADTAQVRQVLLNLVRNAAESLGTGGGHVVVETGETTVRPNGEEPGFSLPPPPGRYATLSVKDNGCGMTPEVAHRMFDPFYSTKFPGRGLGLAGVLGIVRGHNGGIHVATAPGAGTSVTVLFPVTPTARPA